jgi:hypothetical protein
VVDAASLADLAPASHPALEAWTGQVRAAVAAGFAVLSWVELRA